MEMEMVLKELVRMRKANIVKGEKWKTKLKQQEELLEYHTNDNNRALTEYVIGYIKELIDMNNYYKEGIEKAMCDIFKVQYNLSFPPHANDIDLLLANSAV